MKTRIALLFAIFLGIACAQTNHTISQNGQSWRPRTVTIESGDSVTWTWTNAGDHNVLQVESASSVTPLDGGFRSGEPTRSGQFTMKFTNTGDEFETIHFISEPQGNGMRGSIIVFPGPDATETATETEAPTDTATETEAPTETETPTETESPTEDPTGTELPTEEPTDTSVITEDPTGTEQPTEEPTDTNILTEEPTETVNPTETGAGGPRTIQVSGFDFGFDPANLTIETGDTITWSWVGTHNVAQVESETAEIPMADGFNSGLPVENGTFSFTFNNPGTFHYVSEPFANIGMRGVIFVVGEPVSTDNTNPGPQPAEEGSVSAARNLQPGTTLAVFVAVAAILAANL